MNQQTAPREFVKKEICPNCEHQFLSSANPYINQLREEMDVLHLALDKFRSQSHGIPALAEIERLQGLVRAAELQALKAQMAEPVAWMSKDHNGVIVELCLPASDDERITLDWAPLYAAPPAAQDVSGLVAALKTVCDWNLPETNREWRPGVPMTYEACYGSAGARDYMRAVAGDALAAFEEGSADV